MRCEWRRRAATSSTTADYQGTPQELISAVKWGYLYQGQWDFAAGHAAAARRPGIFPRPVRHLLENHDQVANSARGLRLPCPHFAGAVSGPDGLAALVARHAAAVPGAGVRRLDAV